MADHPLYDTDGDEVPYGYPIVMTPREVGLILHVEPRTVSNWAREGKLYCTRTMGGQRRFPEECVRALVEGRWEDAKKEPGKDSKSVYHVV